MAKKKSNIDRFIALTDAEKKAEIEKIVCGDYTPRTLTAKERAVWNKAQVALNTTAQPQTRAPQKMDKKTISLGLDRSLLKRADALAKREGVTRADLIARGLNAVLGS